jgi:ATP-binding cassette subfamily B protein
MALQPHASEFVVADDYAYDQTSPFRWILSHALRYYPYIGSFALGAFCNALGASLIPLLIGIAFNTILSPHPDMQIVALCGLGAFGSQVFRALLNYTRTASAEFIGQRIERDARHELYANLLGKSMAFHSMQSVGDIMARATNDVHELYLMFAQGLNLIIGSGSFLIFPLLLTPGIAPALIITPVIFTIVYVVAVREHLRRLAPLTAQVRSSFGMMNAGLAEALDGIEVVKGASQEPREIQRFRANASAFREAYVRQGRLEARYIPLLALGIATGFAFLHALILMRAGQITVGNVITYMGYVGLYGFPVGVSLYGYSQFSLGIAAARRILKLIQAQTELDQNSTGHTGAIEGAVTFDGVSFAYPEAAPSVQAVNFSVKAGETVAIVGQTGAGKSTLVKLINRTYDPGEGRILVDGIDVRDWNLQSLRSQIAIIEQDIFLFSRSIAENIAFGNPGATQAQIEQAARDAQAHEFILSFKDGYQTLVGSRGVTLSGGQRQRIALARAFLANPRILILDDSTSAIDSATESQIQRAIYRAAQGRTTFLITHRLSQIRWADKVIVLRLGRVVAAGTHDELMRTSDVYRRIFPTESDAGATSPEPLPLAEPGLPH